MACQPPPNGFWGFFKDPFAKELEPTTSLTPWRKKMSSLTSEEHPDNHTWTVEMIRLSNPKVFVPKAFWMPVECTSKWSEQVPKSFVLFGPGYLMSQKMPCSRYFWKNVLIGMLIGIDEGMESLEVFQTQVFLTEHDSWSRLPGDSCKDMHHPPLFIPDLRSFCEHSPILNHLKKGVIVPQDSI